MRYRNVKIPENIFQAMLRSYCDYGGTKYLGVKEAEAVSREITKIVLLQLETDLHFEKFKTQKIEEYLEKWKKERDQNGRTNQS